MIISSHIVAATALTSPLLNRPPSFIGSVLIFIFSFISHCALDIIPHWDYKMLSISEDGGNREFIRKKSFILKDFFKNLLDGFVGLSAAFLIIGFPADFAGFLIFGLAVFGAIFLDILEFYYVVRKNFILGLFHKFHIFIHGKRIFDGKPILGIISQIFVLMAIATLFLIFI